MKKNIARCAAAYMICSFAVADCMVDITSLEKAIPINLDRALTELENCKTYGLKIDPTEEEETRKICANADAELNRLNGIEDIESKSDLETLNRNLLMEGGKWSVKFDHHINNVKKTQDEDYYRSLKGKEMYGFKIVTNITDLPDYKKLPRRASLYSGMTRLKTLHGDGYTVACLFGKPKWDGLNSTPWVIAILKKEDTMYLLCIGINATDFYRYGTHIKELIKGIREGEKILRVITDPNWYARPLRAGVPGDWPMTSQTALEKRRDDLWNEAGYDEEYSQINAWNVPDLLVYQTDEKGREELRGFLESVLGPCDLEVRNITHELLDQ